jgi:hypothetical protein
MPNCRPKFAQTAQRMGTLYTFSLAQNLERYGIIADL